MRGGRRVALAATVGVIVVAVPLLVGATSARTGGVVVNCGDTITKSIVIAQMPVSNCPANGLVVGASNITINMGGLTLQGNGTANAGVLIGSFTNVTVENGTIFNFDTGVSAAGNGEKIQKLAISTSGTNGIEITSGDGDLVSGNFVGQCGGSGILFSGGSEKATVTGNTVQYCTGTGIELDLPVNATVKGNVSVSNGNGIAVGGATGQVSGNIANGNTGAGIGASAQPAKPLTLTVTGNRASFNGGIGIVSSAAKDGGKNVVQDNANAKQCQGIVCTAVKG